VTKSTKVDKRRKLSRARCLILRGAPVNYTSLYFLQVFLLPNLQGNRLKGSNRRKLSIYSQKVDYKYRFFDLKWLDSHSFDDFKCLEATLKNIQKTFLDKPSPFRVRKLFIDPLSLRVVSHADFI